MPRDAAASYKYCSTPMAKQYHTHHRTQQQQQVIMALKIFILIAVVAGANAGILSPIAYSAYPGHLVAAPIAKGVVTKTIDADYDPNPQYSYAYDVQDSLTGDVKSQQESRNGDIVEGSYSLIEPDGSRRIVDYTADPQNGFNAVIRKEAANIAAPVAYAAPVAKFAAPIAKIATPIAYATPIAKVAAPAPAAVLTHKLAAPLSYAAAPAVAAAPLSYVAPITHVSYSTPLFSYSH